MKKLLMVTMIALTSLTSFGQLKEITPTNTLGKIKRGGYVIADITYRESGKYNLTYWDASYRTIDVYTTITFDADSTTLDQLILLFNTQLNAEKNTEKQFGLGNNVITLKTEKAFGVKSLLVYVTGPNGKTGTFHIMSDESNKLFGK